MSFGSLFQSIIQYFTSGKQDTDLDASLALFTTYLNGGDNDKIRLFVADTPGYGHQSSTINILFKLVNDPGNNGFGYKGAIDLYYEVYKPGDDQNVLKKIFQLLPSLNNQLQGGQVNGVTVDLYKWEEGDNPPVQQVNLGFTGGIDQTIDKDGSHSSPRLAQRLNTVYFLRLEPYLWTAPEELQFNNASRNTVVLTTQRLLNYDAFKQRAYYTQLPVPEPDWEYYINNGYSTQIGILQSLLAQVTSYNLAVVYSIRTKGNLELEQTPEDRMFQVITGYLASQENDTAAKPIVMLSMDTFENRTEGGSTVSGLMSGGYTSIEKGWAISIDDSVNSNLSISQVNQLKQQLKPSGYRKQYLEEIDAANRVNYVWKPTTIADVTDKYNWLDGGQNRLLFVQIGRVPSPVFNYLMDRAIMPAVFEGQNTGNLALQFGRPYFHVARPSNSNVQYPTTLLGYNTHDVYEDSMNIYTPVVYVPTLVYEMQQIANLINFRLELWPAKAEDNPAEQIGAFIKGYLSSDTWEYSNYYTSIKAFYQNPANDKFRVGTSFLGSVLQADGKVQPLESVNWIQSSPPATGSPLAALLQTIYDNLDDNQHLNLFPGVFSTGPVFNFISGLLGIQVSLSGAAISPAEGTAAPQTITVTGNSNIWSSVPLVFTITFTAPDAGIVSDWKMMYNGTWLTEELPWLLFENPYVLLTVADTLVPAQGGVGGTLQGLDLDLSIRLPVERDLWQLEGHFAEPASVAKFYQLAGGVNLVQSLPSPFNAFSAIGVTDCQLAYNANTSTIEYISFVMATNEPVQLMQGLQMEKITFNVLVLNPGSLADRAVRWSVAGTFSIGSGTDAGVIVVSMAFPGPVLSGQLASGEIKVTDLFNLFLPGTIFNPEGDSPVITDFIASFDGTTGNYSVVASLNFDWTFQILSSAPAITINQVGVNVQSQNKKLSGGLSGGFTFGQGDTSFSIIVSADYTADEGWVFSGLQQAGNTLKLTDLVNQLLPSGWTIPSGYDYNLKNLSFTFRETKKYYEIGGETDGYWTIPFIDLQVHAALKFGYGTYASLSSPKAKVVSWLGREFLTLTDDETAEQAGYYCLLNADIRWHGIQLSVFYDYNPTVQKFGLTWGLLTGTIAKGADPNNPNDWIGTLRFTDSVSLGTIVEEAINWATGYRYSLSSPWDLLNSLPLKTLELVYNFTKGTVSFKANIGEINLGFCKITGIGLNYQSGNATPEDNGVFITIEGTFFWQSGNTLNWDATKPENTPSPSGQGNKYFDLRLLALGQHVTLPAFADVTSVKAAINAMQNLPPAKPGEIPDIIFDANSSWLVGMNFGVLRLQEGSTGDSTSANGRLLADNSPSYFIDLQIVFNDPNLYALRIALDGAAARIFKGLDFQIMYRKISDSVGVYQAEIALPDVMRKIQLGQVNITLPVFGIEIYTNGDFLVDLGFPKNADFSRSFTLQTIIYVPIPIPVMGSAGLYFGKKSSATSTEVPVIDNGTFNPVIVFGIGIQFGLGYDFSAGILSAGFSLTFVTIIEGVIAKFNPYQAIDTSTGEQSDIAPAYYYSVKGIVGIQGRLYGYVDFKIIKAEVNVLLSVLADITITAYQPIMLGITAKVSISVSIRINLGLFTIKISFSFNITLRESYRINVGGGSAPWHIAAPQPRFMMRSNATGGAFSRWLSLTALQDSFKDTPTWSNLQAPATKAGLTGYIGLGLSIAGDMAAQKTDQLAVYSAMLFIDSVASSEEDPGSGFRKVQGITADTSFETLVKQVFRWVVAAFHDGVVSADEVDDMIISKVRLQEVYNYLNNAGNNDPMPVEAIDSFLDSQITMTVSHPSGTTGDADTTYFPMVPKLTMSLPGFDAQPALNYAFEDYNALSDTYISNMKAYFEDLAVQMQQNERAEMKAEAVPQNSTESLATFIYSDYFLLLARQMLQNAQNALELFEYHLVQNQTVSDIVEFVNSNEQLEEAAYSLGDLFESNKLHLLTTGSSITVNNSVYSTVSEDTFTIIAQKAVYNNSFTPAALATLNKDAASILQSNIQITYPGKQTVTVQSGDSLTDLAKVFDVTIDLLLSTSDVLTLPGLLLPSAKLLLPAINGLSQQNDTLVLYAARYGVSVDTLAQASENAAIPNLFDPNDNDGKIVFTGLLQFKTGQLIAEVQANGGLQQLSGMASRYYLSGLRLPTAQITPAYQGMWLNSQLQYTQSTAGLFSLTGQQFPIPVLSTNGTYTISFSIPNTVQWIAFSNNASSLDISILQSSATYDQVNALRTYAQSNYLDLDIEQLGIGKTFSSSFGHYSFGSGNVWQSGTPVPLPYGSGVDDVQSLNIWILPNDLINLADPAGRAVSPCFEVQTGTADATTKAVTYAPVNNYGWGTQVTFTIKRVPVAVDSPASATTYEISGADGSNALILEQMVKYLGSNDHLIDQVIFAYTPNQANGTNPGLQSDPLNTLIIGIAQANLSTFTRPDSVLQLMKQAAGVEDTLSTYTLLNTPTALIQLLWQASITRDGGYYLYYYDAVQDGGLPGHIFNDKGEAVLSLITIYSNNSEQENLLKPCMNVFVTGDPISVSDSTLFAQAKPASFTASFGATDTLNSLAYQYFTNIGDVVKDNPLAPLSTQITINVAEGTYQVINADGEDLQAIAGKFSTTPDAIKAANPLLTSWPAVLPLYTGLRLPPLTVKPDSNIDTLPAIAYEYGMDLTSLAYYNGDTAGLFVANTLLVMRGGPVTRVATAPAGVLALEAVRTEPAPIPADPSKPDYALLFLQHNFSILTFCLSDNSWFRASNPSLPAGPTNPQPPQPGKWYFSQSVPYYKFANRLPANYGSNGLPDIDTSPYKGIGYLAQADFKWCDIYGNTVLTTLSQPPADTNSIVNRTPVLTGYTDALLSVNQWPSVSVAWQMADGKQPAIQLPLTFDTTPYNGLLLAKATNSTTLSLTFTTAVDTATATNLANYSLSPTIIASAAAMQGSNTVILTVSPMTAEQQYTIVIGNIKDGTTNKIIYSGQATCSYPDVPEAASSSIVQQAANDFRIYTRLWYQFTDPAGIQLSMQTSLFAQEFIIDADIFKDLVDNWITPVYLYLQDRCNGNIAVAPPPSTYTFNFNIHPAEIVQDQIFQVLLSFTIARTGGSIMGDFETTGNVKKVTTNISPATGSEVYQTLSLNNFAEQFESVMSVEGQYYLKIATGADRNKLGQQSPDGTIWAVRVGITDTQPLFYSIENVGAPSLFAPKPVSNQLESRSDVSIYPYTTGSGISDDSYTKNFSEVDMDQWVSSFFGAIDELLTPEFTAPIQLIDKRLTTTYLKELQNAKESLADTAKLLMVAVFEGETSESDIVQEALKQALLVKLTNLYTTNAGIQFKTKVTSDEPVGTPPNLYGNFLQNTVLNGAVSQSGTPQTVNLYFSAPLDANTAVDKSNYTLTAPLVVVSATLGTSSNSVILNASATVTVGATTVTVGDNLLDNNKRPIAGNKVSTITTDYVSYSKPDQLTITAAKIALDGNSEPNLACLLTTPEIVRGQGGEVLSRIEMNLNYKATNIEHQIANPVNGFTPSSWLSFVLPLTRVEQLEKQLGNISVPMVLRSFPQNPTLVNQAGITPNTNNPDISKMLEWDYTFDYSQNFHYPQDTLNFKVDLNVGNEISMLALLALPDAFEQLAEFITVYPSIEVDLRSLVTQIDAKAFNESSPDVEKLFNNASIALASFIKIVQDVTSVPGTSTGFALTSNKNTTAIAGSVSYSFSIQEGPRNLDGVSVQVVSVSGTPPAGIGMPQVLIEPESYEMVPWTNEQNPCEGDVCYYYQNKKDSLPLTSSVAQTIQTRQVVLPQLNILQYQDAFTTVTLTRNQNLIPGKTTSENFVYSSGNLSFPNPYLPSISSDQEIEIANLPANVGKPTKRSLYEQLKVLMETLLLGNTEPELSFQMTCSYNYNINPYLTPMNLPVAMQTLKSVELATDLYPMLQRWTDAINGWLDLNIPSSFNAELIFHLTIFSNLTQQPYPLIDLGNLTIGIQYLT